MVINAGDIINDVKWVVELEGNTLESINFQSEDQSQNALSVTAMKRDAIKIDGVKNDTSINGAFHISDQNSENKILIQFKDFQERFPNQIKLHDNKILLYAWPEASEISDSFEPEEWLDLNTNYNLPYLHMNQGEGLKFEMPESVINKYLEQWSQTGDTIFLTRNHFNNYKPISPIGTAFSLNFNLIISDDDVDNSELMFNPNIALLSGEQFASSMIEGDIYNPSSPINIPLIESNFGTAWSNYKKYVWDNPSQQYGQIYLWYSS